MNQKSYDKIAPQWAAVRNNSFVNSPVVDFADKLPASAHVLDVGCGTGMPLAKYFNNRGFVVTGIDFSAEMISMANSHNIAGAEFIHVDFFDYYSEKKFDGIVGWDSFFHFPLSRQEQIYPKVAGLLKSGGHLLFSHGNITGEHTNPMMGEMFYYSALAKNRVKELLESNGFIVQSMIEDYVEKESHRSLVVLARKS